jgi:hypothetical protein
LAGIIISSHVIIFCRVGSIIISNVWKRCKYQGGTEKTKNGRNRKDRECPDLPGKKQYCSKLCLEKQGAL